MEELAFPDVDFEFDWRTSIVCLLSPSLNEFTNESRRVGHRLAEFSKVDGIFGQQSTAWADTITTLQVQFTPRICSKV